LVMTLYCNPLGVVFTPSFFLFSARNASPSFRFFSPASFCFSWALARIWAEKLIMVSWISWSVIKVFFPSTASFMPWRTVSRFKSALWALKFLPMLTAMLYLAFSFVSLKGGGLSAAAKLNAAPPPKRVINRNFILYLSSVHHRWHRKLFPRRINAFQ